MTLHYSFQCFLYISPVYKLNTQFFGYYAFEQCSKKLPIILNIMPITTASIQKFIYIFIAFNNQISIVRLQSDNYTLKFTYYAKIQCSYVFLTYYAQNYAHEKTCASFCIKLWHDYYITEVFIKTVLKSCLLC